MFQISQTFKLTSLLYSSRLFWKQSQNIQLPLYNVVPSACYSKTPEERIGLPPKPKKPLTPYFRYMQQIRAKVAAENPILHLTDVVKICAKKWETIDEATKQKLENEYQKEKISYIEKRAEYQSTITDEQRNALKSLKQERLDAKEKRAYRKRVRDLGRPKKPASPFLRYLACEIVRIPRPSNVTYRELQKKISETWNSMSDVEKQPYVKSFLADDEKYKKALPQWEEKMIRAGNLDVVRQDVTLLDTPSTKPKAPKTPKPQ